ncbi:MAG: hypothetical protein EOO55_01485 [Hymenobacter sp.]|nr:MAG: hypothetical protein EOO55_01485 [Hymenobacter sp.]
MPQRTESLNKRYFGVLAHTGKSLVEAEPVASRNSTASAKPIQPLVPNNEQGTASLADTALMGKLSKNIAPTTAGSSTWQPAQQLLDSLRRRDVFTHFFVVDLATRRLLYSSSPTGFYLDDAPLARKWPRWLADSSAAHGSRTAELLLNGETYRLFAQPVRIRSGMGILLCGTVPNEQFNKDRWSLPAGWPTTILGLVLLGVLVLPFLKLWLMSTREQLERIDVAYCGAALVLGSGILLLTIQALLVRYGSGQDLIDQQLTGLSRVVAPSLNLLPPAAQPLSPATGRLSPNSLQRAAAVEAQSTLEEQPLPPGFDFCLVDHQGKVRWSS